jgi:hypothetical protein
VILKFSFPLLNLAGFQRESPAAPFAPAFLMPFLALAHRVHPNVGRQDLFRPRADQAHRAGEVDERLRVTLRVYAVADNKRVIARRGILERHRLGFPRGKDPVTAARADHNESRAEPVKTPHKMEYEKKTNAFDSFFDDVEEGRTE